MHNDHNILLFVILCAILCSSVGFTASLNSECTRFYCTGVKQTMGQELAENMQIWMTDALIAFKSHNDGNLPSRIIFYR